MPTLANTVTETAPGSGIYKIFPTNINIPTAYQFEILVYYYVNEPNLFATVPGGTYKLIVGCL